MAEAGSIDEAFKRLKARLIEFFKLEAKRVSEFDRLLSDLNPQIDAFIKKELMEFINTRFASIHSSEKLKVIAEQGILKGIDDFFSRYFIKGDFLPVPRHSGKKKYSLMSDDLGGSLHWANQDEYFMKSERMPRNLVVKEGDLTISFIISSASVNLNNVQSQYLFVLSKDVDGVQYKAPEKHLIMKFEYRSLSDREAEDIKKFLGDTTGKNLKGNIDNGKMLPYTEDQILNKITSPEVRSRLSVIGDKEKNTCLGKKLKEFFATSNESFFIHKDLNGFLMKELHFYIKNDFLDVYDMTASNPNLELNITKVAILEAICKHIIEFLAKIENLKRLMWEKKKFVIQAEYCMTIDKVPADLYAEILSNERQLKEWKELFLISEKPAGQLEKSLNIKSQVNVDFIRAHPNLVIDTRYFTKEFKNKLLASIPNLDDQIDGLLVKSDNFHALNFLVSKYGASIDLLYIDPPYNTGHDEFAYKDNYQDSCWLTLLQQSLDAYKPLASAGSGYFISIDDNEITNLSFLARNIFGDKGFCGRIIVRAKPGGRQYTIIAKNQEYVVHGLINPDGKKMNSASMWLETPVRTENGTKLLNTLFKTNPGFDFPKPIELIMNCISCPFNKPGIVMDFFAGTGSTAHAVLKYNAENKTKIKYIQVEMGEYFETIMIPRLKKLMYSKDWKAGKPTGSKGIGSHAFKYLLLEQYEDVINNLALYYAGKYQAKLDIFGSVPKFYKFSLDKGSGKLAWNMNDILDPRGVTIGIWEKGVFKQKEIDVVETFNYLAGITVDTFETKMHKGSSYIIISGKTKSQRVLVVWRKVREDADFLDIDKAFLDSEILPRYEYDVLYLNGKAHESVKFARIEDKFTEAMMIE